jgi:AbrB family looped-hinge helix DNA binding protein
VEVRVGMVRFRPGAMRMKVSSKGQVTIPADIRERLGLLPESEVEFKVVGGAVQLRKVPGRRSRGRSIVGRLRGRGSGKLSTDEIMALTRGD